MRSLSRGMMALRHDGTQSAMQAPVQTIITAQATPCESLVRTKTASEPQLQASTRSILDKDHCKETLLLDETVPLNQSIDIDSITVTKAEQLPREVEAPWRQGLSSIAASKVFA